MPSRPHVICFGEILWDFLPAGLFPGGAPFNVAYHLHQHRVEVLIASAIGRDLLGDELMRRLDQWGVPTAGIARLPRYRTGFVRAEIGAAGNAHYDIVPRVAWDHLVASPATLQAAAHTDAFIFGSLAQRSSNNRRTLEQLFETLPEKALRIFDVNLRAPYDNLPLVRRLAAQADVLKLNDSEAARLVGKKFRVGDDENCARQLAAELGCARIVITAAERGAGFLHDGQWYWEKGRRVKVVDTVGAGDSFLASFVSHLLAGTPDKKLLSGACRLGEWVATQSGATPTYTAATPK